VENKETTEDAIRRIRERLAARLAERKKQKVATPPRYDAEFFEGLEWLNSL